MSSWLTKKINILKYEAKSSGSSMVYLFGKKTVGFVIRTFILTIDLFIILLLLPFVSVFILVYNILYKKTTHKKTAFLIGLEHVINKSAQRAQWLESKGFSCFFFSFEWSGHKCDPIYKPAIIKYSRFIFYDTLVFVKYLIRYKPMYLEVYFEGGGHRQFLACVLAKIFNVLSIVIERGIYQNTVHINIMPYSFKLLMVKSMQLADYVFYRDPLMIHFFREHKLNESKLVFDYNKVKINPEELVYDRKPEIYKVLFLNAFIQDRKLEILVRAIPLVRAKIPNVIFDFIGARSETEVGRVQSVIRELKVEEFANVHYWSKNPSTHFSEAHVYVFPALYVFCNFSLLEAMERGLPAIVSKVDGAERIVEDGINGYLAELNEHAFAEKIVQLLSDDERRIRMGKEARNKMIREYDSSTRMLPIYDLIKHKYKLA